MAGYLCKEPGCTDSVAWHLQHGEWDCLADNREAVAEFARNAEALAAAAPNLIVNIDAHADGYEGQTFSIVLKPGGAPPPVVEEPPLEPPMDMG